MPLADELPGLMDADPDMVSAMEPWLTQLGNFRMEVIGEAKHEMTGERSPGVRTEEAAMGNYITDALRYYVDTYRQDLISNFGDIDFVVQNGGGIRAGLGVGDITVNNIMTILPFGNVFSIIRLTGAKVMETLEQSVSGVEDAEGRFLQVSTRASPLARVLCLPTLRPTMDGLSWRTTRATTCCAQTSSPMVATATRA